MNGWAEVMRMLVEDPDLRELIIAPHAPPVSSPMDGRRVVISDLVFSDVDVAETLTNAAAHSSGRRSGELGPAGILSLGVRDVGRIRISYFTQRGSRVIRVVRVPFDVSTIDAVCLQPPRAHDLVKTIGTYSHRLILVYGPSQVANGQLVYALLGEINKTYRKMIFIAERMLSFLMAHDNSVVIQVEVPTDTPSLEDAIQQALFLEPDVVHVGNIQVTDDLPSLPQLINANTCTILSTVSTDASLLLSRIPPSLHRSLAEHDTGMLLHVSPGEDGRLNLETPPWPARNPSE